MSQGNDLESNERDVVKDLINPQNKRAWTLTQSWPYGRSSSAAGVGLWNHKLAFVLALCCLGDCFDRENIL